MKKKNKSFFKTYKWILLLLGIVLIIGFIAIYLIFIGKGIIPAGKNLAKSDWLSFIGGYLSFAGTLSISTISVLQTDYYNKRQDERIKKEKEEAIQPHFSVALNGANKDDETFSVVIQNMGKYPISNVIVNSTLITNSLRPKESKIIYFAYSDVENHIKLLKNDFEKDETGYSKDIVINYDDIHGNLQYQIFELKSFENVLYYSFEFREKVI